MDSLSIWPYHGSGNEQPASHREDSGSIPSQSMWYLWWKKCHTDRLLFGYFGFPCQYHSTKPYNLPPALHMALNKALTSLWLPILHYPPVSCTVDPCDKVDTVRFKVHVVLHLTDKKKSNYPNYLRINVTILFIFWHFTKQRIESASNNLCLAKITLENVNNNNN